MTELVESETTREARGPDTLAYRKTIQILAANSVNQRIPNGMPAHAAILLEAMFKKAKADMRIFTGSLSLETYGDAELIDAAQRFLKRQGTRLRILIQKRHVQPEIADHPLIVALSGVKAGLQLRFAAGAYSQDTAKHMAVMDDVGFRFETDHSKTIAVANFNEPAVAVELATAFDSAFSMASPAPL